MLALTAGAKNAVHCMCCIQAPAATPPAELAAACMTSDANLMDLEGEAWAALDNLPNDLDGVKKENTEDVLEGPV